MRNPVFFVTLIPLLIGAAAACSGTEPPKVAPQPASTVAPPREADTPEAKPADDPDAGLVTLVCGRRKPCSLLTKHEAGVDEKGQSLSVALFYVGVRHDDPEGGDSEESAGDEGEAPSAEEGGASSAVEGGAPSAVERPTEAKTKEEQHPNVTFTQTGERFDASYSGACKKYEYWRVTRQGTELVDAHPVTSICNDGHGVSGIGEDMVFVGPNRMEISSSGGSAWRWSNDRMYSLSPFVMETESRETNLAAAFNHEDRKSDWKRFVGETTWFSPPCAEDGSPQGIAVGDAEFPPDYAYTWIPSVELPADYLATGWKTTRIEGCSASIDATGKAGYLISGEASTAQDTRIRILSAQDKAFVIEVEDDKLVGEDRLEVWLGPPLQDWSSSCVFATQKDDVVSWNVRATDGKVTPATGKPKAKALPVERASGEDGSLRFKISLPEDRRAMTVVYADSDGGKKVERRIATSRLSDKGYSVSLGDTTPVDERAWCSVKEGRLIRGLKAAAPGQPD